LAILLHNFDKSIKLDERTEAEIMNISLQELQPVHSAANIPKPPIEKFAIA
jgi:hypothetical protein